MWRVLDVFPQHNVTVCYLKKGDEISFQHYIVCVKGNPCETVLSEAMFVQSVHKDFSSLVKRQQFSSLTLTVLNF